MRGFRIEPAEVEAAFERHPGVAQAFVAVREGPGNEQHLTAWCIADRGITATVALTADDVRSFAAHSLPAHLMPSAVAIVDDFPLTPSGKVDLAALPAPVPARGAGRSSGGEPAVVHRLCELFAEVLQHDVHPDDSFFALGGHSLMAVRLFSRVRHEFDRRLSLRALHDSPTPRGLAEELAKDEVGCPFQYLLPIQPLGHRIPLFGVHVLGPNAAFYRPLAARLGDDQPVYTVGNTALDLSTPTDVVEVAALYVADIERFSPTGPVALAGVSMAGYVALEVAKQLVARGHRVALVAIFDASGPGWSSAGEQTPAVPHSGSEGSTPLRDRQARACTP